MFLVRTVGNETYDQATKEPYNPNRFTVSGSLDYYINDKNSGSHQSISVIDSDNEKCCSNNASLNWFWKR
mgnify:CR=1 FL=1